MCSYHNTKCWDRKIGLAWCRPAPGQPFELLPMCRDRFGNLNLPKRSQIQGHVGRVKDHSTSQLTRNLSGATCLCRDDMNWFSDKIGLRWGTVGSL